jgi:hypothetical protein
MNTINIDIDLVEIYDRTAHTVRVLHIWPDAGDKKIEWWMSEDGNYHAIYRQDAYYDVTLQQRRNKGNMICPQDKSQRLVFIGDIVSQINLEPSYFFEISRSHIALKNVAENEK